MSEVSSASRKAQKTIYAEEGSGPNKQPKERENVVLVGEVHKSFFPTKKYFEDVLLNAEEYQMRMNMTLGIPLPKSEKLKPSAKLLQECVDDQEIG